MGTDWSEVSLGWSRISLDCIGLHSQLSKYLDGFTTIVVGIGSRFSLTRRYQNMLRMVFMGLSMSDCGCRAGLHRISSMTQRRIQSQIMMYRTGPDRKMWSSSV